MSSVRLVSGTERPRTGPTLPVRDDSDVSGAARPGDSTRLNPPEESDDYIIVEPLGKGGMGQVYRARDKVLNRDVAIKFLLHANDEGFKRLAIEARAAARFVHPNIAHIYRLGRWRSSDENPTRWDGQPYLVEEYVRGRNLATMRKPMPWQDALAMGLALTRGLAATHRYGVLHRDVKPANVIVTEEGNPKLIDFGLAKLLGADAQPNAPSHGPSRASAADETDRGDDTNPAVAGEFSLTDDDAFLGTPSYMAPELWQGCPATRQTDVYALGVLLFELCSGRTPFHTELPENLDRAVTTCDAPTLGTVAPEVDARFAAIINQCLARMPEQRFRSADALRDALEELTLTRMSPRVVDGDPYPGLRAFGGDKHAFFFGREREIREVVDRLRTRSILLIAGESGAGKSSLIRAGVLPLMAEHGLDGQRWRSRLFVPGRRPMARLAHEIGQILDIETSEIDERLVGELLTDPVSVASRLQRIQTTWRGTILVVDQLEELVTLSEPEEANKVGEILVILAERVQSLRVVATVRGDKITEISRLPGLGARMGQGNILFVQPLGTEEIREAIVGPARVKGVHFASDALIDTLVESTLSARSGLPLLQFTLSRIWQERDVQRALIPENALKAVGGVEGALSRHADGVLKTMLPRRRQAARRILVRLVTAHRTRARYSLHELTADGDEYVTALHDLVDGRLLVEGENDGESVYELAHEVLITGWTQLRHWLDKEGDLQAVKERLADAAAEWKRMGENRDVLWRGQALAEAAGIAIDDLPALDRRFLLASRRATRRRRWVLRAAIVIPILAALGLYLLLRYQDRIRTERQREERIQDLLNVAAPLKRRATEAHELFRTERNRAYERFKKGADGAGEDLWRQALASARAAETGYREAGNLFLQASFLNAQHHTVRTRWAEVLDEHAHLAYELGHEADRTRLVQQLAIVDGGRALRWSTPVLTRLWNVPEGAKVRVERYRELTSGNDAGRMIRDLIAEDRIDEWMLPPGSYLFTVEATSATVKTRYPLVVEPVAVSKEKSMDVSLRVPPHPGQIRPGFIYIPGGEFLYGYGRDRTVEAVRRWYNAQPIHVRTMDAFLIARYETTFDDWLEYLQARSSESTPPVMEPREDPSRKVKLALTRDRDGRYALEAGFGGDVQRSVGNLYTYPARLRNQTQKWMQFPVLGVSPLDIEAYMNWLDSTGRVPGARMCREDEWEKAVRGADGRLFAHGNALAPSDANIDVTYGQKEGAFGPDQVDLQARSPSPFGLLGTVGNAREIVSPVTGDMYVLRGGAFFFSERTAAAVNRAVLPATDGYWSAGFRVCASIPTLP